MLYPDADLMNADWTKRSWDLGIGNVEDLRTWLKSQGITVAAFKRLPVYKCNVSKLKWLEDL
jgi:hypothetical protein